MTNNNTQLIYRYSFISFAIISCFLMFGYIGLNYKKLSGKKETVNQSVMNPSATVSSDFSLIDASMQEQTKTDYILSVKSEKLASTSDLTPEQKAYQTMEKQHENVNDVFMQLNQKLTQELKKQSLGVR